MKNRLLVLCHILSIVNGASGEDTKSLLTARLRSYMGTLGSTLDAFNEVQNHLLKMNLVQQNNVATMKNTNN